VTPRPCTWPDGGCGETRGLLEAIRDALENGRQAEVLGALDYVLGGGSNPRHATETLRERERAAKAGQP
jgi:hypothetical protein